MIIDATKKFGMWITMPADTLRDLGLTEASEEDVIASLRVLASQKRRLEDEIRDMEVKRMTLLREGFLLGCETQMASKVKDVVELWVEWRRKREAPKAANG